MALCHLFSFSDFSISQDGEPRDSTSQVEISLTSTGRTVQTAVIIGKSVNDCRNTEIFTYIM